MAAEGHLYKHEQSRRLNMKIPITKFFIICNARNIE